MASAKVKRRAPDGSAPVRGASRRVNRGPLAGYLGHALMRARATVFAEITQRLQKFGLNGGEFGALVVIQYNPGLRFVDVTRALGFREANFAPLIRRLEQRGLVTRRTSSADKRTQNLILTPQGEQLISEAVADQNLYEASLVKRIGKTKAKGLIRSLMRVAGDSSQDC